MAIELQDAKRLNDLILENGSASFSSPTGSGKSTLIPEFLVKNFGRKILVVEPTSAAASSLYMYMSSFIPDLKVGYAYEGKKNYTKNDDIIYLTGGHMKKLMISNQKFVKNFDIIFLDEFHLGLIDYEIIEIIWQNDFDGICSLITGSATSSSGGLVLGKGITRFKVKEYYHEKFYRPKSKEVYFDVVKVVEDFHMKRKITEDDNTWLIFCPGIYEVSLVESYLEDLAERGDLMIVKYYSSINTPEQYKKIYDLPPPGVRKIILSTNIAETAVTFNNLSGVFDTMTEKIMFSGEDDPFSQNLEIHHISKASAIQRKGRTGRTVPGFIYRMMPKWKYEKLEDQRLHELKRVNLFRPILELIKTELDPYQLLDGIEGSDKYYKIVKKKIKGNIEVLKEHLLMLYNNSITYEGNLACDIPLSDIRMCVFILSWMKRKYPVFPGVVLSAVIDTFNGIYTRDEDVEKDDPLIFNLNMIKYYLEENDWNLSPSFYSLTEWCDRRNLKRKEVGDTLELIKHLHIILEEELVPVNFSVDNLISLAHPMLEKLFGESLSAINGKTTLYLPPLPDAASSAPFRIGMDGLDYLKTNALNKVLFPENKTYINVGSSIYTRISFIVSSA